MQLGEAKIRVELGDLKEAHLVPSPMSRSWRLMFDDHSTTWKTYMTSRGKVAEFKTLDAAAKVAFGIGFKRITIQLDNLLAAGTLLQSF